MSLFNGNAKTLNSHGIFCTDVDVALLSTAGIAGDGHGFQNGMRVALKDGSVHECARVTFISVAADVFHGSHLSGCGFPLDAEREACAASSAEHCILHRVHNVLGVHVVQTLSQSLIALDSDILLDVHGIDETAVLESDLHLLGIEGVIFKRVSDLGSVCFSSKKTFHRLSAHYVGVPDLFHVLRLHVGVHDLIGIGDHERSLGAKAHASCGDKLYLRPETVFFDLFLKVFIDAH